MAEATSGTAWVRAILAFEGALARAEARVGVIPQEAGRAISETCASLRPDPGAIAEAAVATGTPFLPILAELRNALPAQHADFTHWGATSQDALDTAMMLVARDATDLLVTDLRGLAASAAGLASSHRNTIMAGRTLLQHAVPITFGLKAGNWLSSVVDAHAGLLRWRSERLALQFGGASGTLAALGADGPAVSRYLAEELGLPEPPLPWHTARGRIAELASGLGIAAGAAGKIALDVLLMAQTEVGEVAERAAEGKGASSAMPQKRNPVEAVAALSAMRQAQAIVPPFFASMAQEHERAAGAWQAEFELVSHLFQATAAAVRGAGNSLGGLVVNPERMRANLESTGGLIMAEAVGMLLASRLGRSAADQFLADAVSATAGAADSSFRDALAADPRLAGTVSREEIDAALAPERYLGSSDLFIDRALAAFEAMPA